MALLRLIYDGIVVLTFYLSGVHMYYQHKHYEYSTHPLAFITCKIGAIILILLSLNIFFSNYVNNFVYIIHMKRVGLQRYIKEETADVEENNEVPDAAENRGNEGQSEAAAGEGQSEAAAGEGQSEAAAGEGQSEAAAGEGQSEAAAGEGQSEAAAGEGQSVAAAKEVENKADDPE